ncbi:hypothetical protein, partial [Flavobacterium sp.]|uniref:hypothetical protein n=1 Tax=Flavobacterium sp. TaxID=239 RepID=UPI002634B7F5
DWIAYIIFFTFAVMKRKQKRAASSSTENQNNKSLSRMLKRFNAFKDNFDFGIFHYQKVEHEKLQIIYANIRV